MIITETDPLLVENLREMAEVNENILSAPPKHYAKHANGLPGITLHQGPTTAMGLVDKLIRFCSRSMKKILPTGLLIMTKLFITWLVS